MRRALVAAAAGPLVEFRFPRARVLGRAASLSSDPALPSLTPRTELPVSDPAPLVCGDVLTDRAAGTAVVRAWDCDGGITGYCCTAGGGCVVLRPCASINRPLAASLSCGSKGPVGGFGSALSAAWPPLAISCGWDVGATGWLVAACCCCCCCWACACSRLAAAALTAVRWKSMVPGVAAGPPVICEKMA